MKRRDILFALICAVSVLIGMQVVEVVDANPVPWLSTPNREKPVLTLQTPTNQTIYKTEVPIDFSVTAPKSWATYATRLVGTAHYVGEVKCITVYFDSKPLMNYTSANTVSYFYGNKTLYPIRGFDGQSTHYIFNLNKTSSGSHTLNITVVSFTYADGDPIDNTAIPFKTGSVNGEIIYAYKYPNVVSQTVSFTIEEGNMPAATSQVDLSPAIPYILLAVIVTAAIASALLVFFKKRKPKLA
jgi:hypothetical protein